jgi:hypothetical protein
MDPCAAGDGSTPGDVEVDAVLSIAIVHEEVARVAVSTHSDCTASSVEMDPCAAGDGCILTDGSTPAAVEVDAVLSTAIGHEEVAIGTTSTYFDVRVGSVKIDSRASPAA